MSSCCLTTPRKSRLEPQYVCLALAKGTKAGAGKKSQCKKNQNPNLKWFILGFPVSECLLKTQERGQALSLAARPHSERQGRCGNSAPDRLVSGSVCFRQGFICPGLGKSNPRLPPRVDEGTVLGLAFQHPGTGFHGPE